MDIIVFLSLLLAFITQLDAVNGGTIALRHRPKDQLLSRSTLSNGTIFDPTDEEVFYAGNGDPNTVVKTIHQTSRRKYISFERFEDYLRPQERLCTPSLDHKTMLLSFPLNPSQYRTARERWAGKKGLVFMGHGPSCHALEEQRSSYKSLSIAFDNASQTIRVTGKPLFFGHRHYPAPTELIVGRGPGDIILTRRTTSEKGSFIGCIKHPKKCIEDGVEEGVDHIESAFHHLKKAAKSVIKKLDFDIDVTSTHINFNGKNNEQHKKYWPPETSGGADQEFHMTFNALDHFDDDDDDDDDDDKDEDEGKIHAIVRDHVKRAFVKYKITDEINPGSAKEDTKGRRDAMEPKTEDNPKSGKGVELWGYQFWNMDMKINVYLDFSISSKINLTLPGFEATIPAGSELEIDLMSEEGETGIQTQDFDPTIMLLPADLTLNSTAFHFNIAVGPKAKITIGLLLPVTVSLWMLCVK